MAACSILDGCSPIPRQWSNSSWNCCSLMTAHFSHTRKLLSKILSTTFLKPQRPSGLPSAWRRPKCCSNKTTTLLTSLLMARLRIRSNISPTLAMWCHTTQPLTRTLIIDSQRQAAPLADFTRESGTVTHFNWQPKSKSTEPLSSPHSSMVQKPGHYTEDKWGSLNASISSAYAPSWTSSGMTMCPMKMSLRRLNSPVLSPSFSNSSCAGQGTSQEWKTPGIPKVVLFGELQAGKQNRGAPVRLSPKGKHPFPSVHQI